MKRDMDLLRKILLVIEAHPEPYGVELKIDGYSEPMISYHIKLLAQAGLVEAQDDEAFGEFEWAVNSLTWTGHEFLEASRDDSRWEKVKRLLLEKTGGLSFEVLKAGLVQAMLLSIS